MDGVMRAQAAGTFYPADPTALRRTVAAMLAAAPGEGAPPRAIIAPHAGYEYSGPVAAFAYARVAGLRGAVRRVVLLGPSHCAAFPGAAAPEARLFATPLGGAPVDGEAVARVLELPWVRQTDGPFHYEHCLEVHLPFLQIVLGDFALVPLLVGSATDDRVCRTIEYLWTDAETLIVVSTDLSHYLPYDEARRRDEATCRAIEALRPEDIVPDQACGRAALAGLLLAVRARGLRVGTLDLRNSGDTAGMRGGVVGYGAWAVVEE